jgi:kinesin family protein 12
MSEKEPQDKVFDDCGISEFIDSALEGYSATVFAYGQTGSGKTYTMAGNEEIFTNDIYQRDSSEGIIPRAIHCLWDKISQSQSNYYIKASYTEIYNEQIGDLLNLSSGVLHCRWNPASGFFVEDLVIVDCTNVDDMIAVLHEGMQNRHSASH